jgi:tyrosyl-tRNA synthetase
MPTGADLLAELDQRGLVQDCTSIDALAARLDQGTTTLYCGFDPTADSLHLGNLQSIMLLRRYQLAGHAPLALVGGATGMIGDPSGRSDERQFLDPDVLDANRASIAEQLASLLDFTEGPSAARLVDNRTWTEPMPVLEFLRDVGKYMTVNTMLAKESVKNRMDRESGISFTEFSYMLLQAHDFLVLHRDLGCDLQVAGSDQWGNITAGVDLVRRRTGHTVHGMTAPLIVRADGTKFGKSEGENIWLSPARTSPYRMYQYLLNVPDAELGTLLLRLTTVPVAECHQVVADHEAHPERREGQRRLARELTALVHGQDVIAAIEAAAQVLFGRPIDEADPAAFALLEGELGTTRIPAGELDGLDPIELFTRSGLAKSKGEVRRNPGGYHLNQVPLEARAGGIGTPIGNADLRHGRFLLLRRGKTAHHLVVTD